MALEAGQRLASVTGVLRRFADLPA